MASRKQIEGMAVELRRLQKGLKLFKKEEREEKEVVESLRCLETVGASSSAFHLTDADALLLRRPRRRRPFTTRATLSTPLESTRAIPSLPTLSLSARPALRFRPPTAHHDDQRPKSRQHRPPELEQCVPLSFARSSLTPRSQHRC